MRSPLRRCASRATRVVEQHQREQALRVGFRQQLNEQTAESNRLARQIVSRHPLTGGGRVALVEHEIDDPEHGLEPLRQLRAGRHFVRNARVANLCLSLGRSAGRASAPASGTRCAISSVVRPQTSRSVSATCASGASAGWQQVKISRSRSSSTLSSSAHAAVSMTAGSAFSPMSSSASKRVRRRAASIALKRPAIRATRGDWTARPRAATARARP